MASSEPPPSDPAALRPSNAGSRDGARSPIEDATTARLDLEPRASSASRDQPERVSAEPVADKPPAARPKSDPPAPPPPRTSQPPPPPPDLPPVPRSSGAPSSGGAARGSAAAARAASNPPTEPISESDVEMDADEAMAAAAKRTVQVPPEAIGRTLDGRYLIEERLGVGGVGAVYLGTQLALGRSVAIKLLHEGLDPSFRTRFEREAKALAALRHPNIVSVTDYGVDGATPYLVMEKLEGETLGERLTRGPLLPEHVLELARQLLRALGFVHEQGLVHRDLKPGNLFLELTPDGDERLKLLDFGLAKFVQEPGVDGQTVTRAGHVVGTPAYMAPEQIAGDAVDARSDIYAVGVLLYQALSGRVPFEGEPMEQLKGHLVAPVPPLTIGKTELKPRAELNALIMRALEKRRDARYGSALEMLVALEAIPQPWLVDAVLVDGAQDDEAQAAAKTVVHAGAAKRHAAAQKQQKQASRWRGRVWLAFLMTLGVMALIGVQQLRSRIPRFMPRPIPPAAVSGERPGGAEAERGDDVDMVIALPEAAHEAPPTEAGGNEAPAAESSEPGALVAPSEPGVAGAAEQAISGEDTAPAASPEATPAASAETDDTAAATATTATTATNTAMATATTTPATASQPAGWRNPWLRDTPAALRQIRKAVMDGSTGNDRMITTLRKYNRTAEHDARGHLLLARMYLNRGWRDDALNQYTIAYQVDPSARGAPKMLSDLLGLVAAGKNARDASRFVREAYGSEALRELDRALLTYKQDPAAIARLKALRSSIAGS